jgi:nucleotide-binding universal stress UspA family protein
MRTILVPVDGSQHALRAIDVLIGRVSRREPIAIHLLNVQHSVTGDVGQFLDQQQIDGFHREEALKVLATARQKLDDANVPYTLHIGVGNPADIILQYAAEKACNEIVMGAQGHSAIAELLLGSVAAAVKRRAEIPVQLVE